MSPIKVIIFAGVVSCLVLLPAFLFTRDKPKAVTSKRNKYNFLLGQFFIYLTLTLLLVFTVLLIYGLMVSYSHSKYPTLQPWIDLKEIYAGPFKNSWEN